MSNWTLYDINETFQQALDAARAATNPETGEMPESWDEFLTACEMERDAKVINCARVVKSLDGEADAIREEEKRLSYRRKSLEGEVSRLKQYVLNNIKPGETFKDATAAVSTRTTPHVVVDPLTALPEQYTRVTIAPDKVAIRAALKAGTEIKGCSMENSVSLIIK